MQNWSDGGYIKTKGVQIMDKLSFVELLQTNKKICVLCPTQSQANKLIKLAKQEGVTMSGSVPDDFYWNDFGSRTCYFFNRGNGTVTFGNVDYAKKHDFYIYKMNMFTEFTITPQDVFEELLNRLILEYYPKLKTQTKENEILILNDNQTIIKINVEQNFISFTPSVEQSLLIHVKHLLEEQTAPLYHIQLMEYEKFKEDYPYLIRVDGKYRIIPTEELYAYSLSQTTFDENEFEQIKSENKVLTDLMILVERI